MYKYFSKPSKLISVLSFSFFLFPLYVVCTIQHDCTHMYVCTVCTGGWKGNTHVQSLYIVYVSTTEACTLACMVFHKTVHTSITGVGNTIFKRGVPEQQCTQSIRSRIALCTVQVCMQNNLCF